MGSYPKGASPHGVMDMAGNVWEWCSDWFADNYYKDSPSKNPTGPSQGPGRVVRGGCWDVDSRNVRCAIRGGNVPAFRAYYLGFRLSQDVKAK